MPRNVERDRECRKERCDQILEAAVQLFSEKGIAATKISDIANKAGMSHGLIYNYFQSKEEIYISIVDNSLSGLKRNIEQVQPLRMDPQQKLTRLLDTMDCRPFQEAMFQHIFIDQLLVSETVSPALKHSVKSKMLANVHAVSTIIREGQASGQFVDGDPRELAYYLLTLIQSFVFAEARGAQFIRQSMSGHLIRFFLK
ncbi:TetR/AcrR family transcriptional regulator [Paenibacillus sp. MSJ-34]|uniref:TetR/AcrR family transcriptional regulator n=1 Tax=Paenibacillus sp. MSJ-34 TaxID=2841529 RepID=UPI001C128317|nr:TetR/AcrR family transcriptional regulator [Paenibacillus sp. MSJ-34]